MDDATYDNIDLPYIQYSQPTSESNTVSNHIIIHIPWNCCHTGYLCAKQLLNKVCICGSSCF